MKQKFFAICTAFVLLLSLTACGASSKGEAESFAPAASAPAPGMMNSTESYYGSAEDTAMEAPAPTTPAEGQGGATPTGQKLIRRASLEMETLEFSTTDASLTDLVERMNGYMESVDLRNRSNGYRSADYTIRIPAARFEEFLDQAGALCHETWRSVSQEDISEVYYDTQGRLKTQQIKLERLQELLSKAETMEDIITIESSISECEQYIDELSGRLRHYDGKVDYATITLSLREVYQYSNTQVAPTTFGERMGNAFAGGLGSFADTLEDLAVSFAYSWIYLVILAAVLVLVIRTARRAERKRKQRKAEKENSQNNG